MAYYYIQKCTMSHGQPAEPESPFAATGQNIFAIVPQKELNYTEPLKKWYSEKVNYNFDDQSCSTDCGHYTQVKPSSCDILRNY